MIQSEEQGFTLIEVLVAGVVLACAVTGIMGFLLFLEKTEEKTTLQLCAALYAQEKLEELRFMSAGHALPVKGGNDTIDSSCGRFTRSWDVRSYAKMDGLYEMEVCCYYLWNSEEKGVVLKSLVPK